MMRTNWRTLAPLFVGALLLLAAFSSSPVLAQSSGGAQSPEVKKVMRYGLAAAKQQEWSVAIKYFGKARESAPYSPEVLFNLALANDSAGGRELLAIAWFHAFLAAAPGAANAEQVRDRIVELSVKVEANAAKLIVKAREAAGHVPDLLVTDYQWEAGRQPLRFLAYRYLAIGQAETGDIAGAIVTAERITKYLVPIIRPMGHVHQPGEPKTHYMDGTRGREKAFRGIALALGKTGDIAGALAIAERISDPHLRAIFDSDLSNPLADAAEEEISSAPDYDPYGRELEMNLWTAMIEEHLDKPLFQDPEGFILSLTGRESLETVKSLTVAAAELVEALRTIRRIDVAWQPHRLPLQ